MGRSLFQMRNTILAIAVVVLAWNASLGSAGTEDLFDSVQSKHHIISYSLPRVGLTSKDDCNLSIYKEEFNRDIALMKKMGATAVHLLCPWSTDPLVDHTELLKTLVENQLSFIVTLRTDIYQIEQRGGEKEFQEGMYVLNDELAANPEAKALLKGIAIQYTLTGETASFFFEFVNKVKFWMNLLELDVPLMVPWVADISLDDKDIETQLTQWNSASFDAWMTSLYTPGEIQNYINHLGSAAIAKKVFLMYGWDSYNTLQNKEDQTDQAEKIQALYFHIVGDANNPPTLTDSNNTILGTSLFSFADIYYAGEEDKFVYGDPSATCPDANPWLQTSCGRMTSESKNNTQWTSDSVSVEIMGLFEHYETISLQRCVRPKLAAKLVGLLFTGNDVELEPACVLAVSNPFIVESLLAPAGVVFIAAFISFILCCMRPARTAPKPPKEPKAV